MDSKIYPILRILLLSVLTYFLILPCGDYAANSLIILTSGSTWTVPADWNQLNNKIEVIAGGSSGTDYNACNLASGLGGGGGGYSVIVNTALLTPGQVVGISIGAGASGITGGGGQPGGDTYLCKDNTGSCSDSQNLSSGSGWGASVIVGAKGGQIWGGSCLSGSSGGQAAQGMGDIKFSGGSGGGNAAMGRDFGNSGGGAAGPNGNGGSGASSAVATAAGGGGNGGGFAGAGTGQGGNNYLNAGGGASGNPGSAGTNGGGGGGGTGNGAGGAGGNGSEWGSAGSGGGGGGGSSNSDPGGAGGLYGGASGGGGAGSSGNNTNASQGIIVISYIARHQNTIRGNTIISGNSIIN